MKTINITTARYGEYLRKSTDDKEKQVLSLSSQRDVLDHLKKTHELNIIETIEEKKSAKRPGRPGFNLLIKLIKAGKINGIVAWAPHRLSRNSVDNGEIINLFDTGHLREIVTESYTYRNNPMDIFMFGFHCLQAKFENDNKALDVKAGMAKCAQIGIFPGRPPLGYLTDKGGIKGARKRDIDPFAFPIVRKMWETILAKTHTPTQVIDMAINKWGLRNCYGKKPALSSVYSIFHNTFYYGEYEFPKKSGNVFKGIHKPMVTKAEFIRVQMMLRKPDSPRPIKHYFSYGGCSLRCGSCGCAMTGERKIKRQLNGNVHQYTYYKCTKRKGPCSQQPVIENNITQDIEQILSSIQMPQLLHKDLLDWVRQKYEDDGKKDGVSSLQANKHKLEQIQNKIKGLINMRTSDLINDDEFREQKMELENEKVILNQLISDTTNNKSIWLQAADKIIDLAIFATWRFKNASPEERRRILLELGSDLTVNDKKLDLSRINWVVPLMKITKEINLKLSEFGTVLSMEHKAKLKSFLHSPLMCSLLKEVRNSFIKNPNLGEPHVF